MGGYSLLPGSFKEQALSAEWIKQGEGGLGVAGTARYFRQVHRKEQGKEFQAHYI